MSNSDNKNKTINTKEGFERGLTPEIITDKNIKFNIPIYQRLFEWNEEQIEQLLDDLLNSYKKNSTNPYYIGMLTTRKNDEQYDLVDGQQRFVVLTLLGLILRKYCKNWRNFLANNEPSEPRLTFTARKNDQEYLKSLIDEKEGNKTQENKRIKNGLCCIENWFKSRFKNCYNCTKESSCSYSSLNKFANYIFTYTTFFISTLPENYKNNSYKQNQYFERMNSAGKNLEQHEILKVNCLEKLKESSPQNLDDKKAMAIWNIVSQMNKPIIRTKDNEKEKVTEKYKAYLECLIANRSDITSLLEDNKVCLECLIANRSDITSLLEDNKNNLSNCQEQKISDIDESTKPPTAKDNEANSYNGCHSMLTFSEFLLLVLWLKLKDDNKQKEQTITDFFDVNKLLTTYKTITDNKDWNWSEFYRDLLLYRVIYDLYVIRISDRREYNNDSNDKEDYYNLDYLIDDNDKDNKDNKYKRKLVQFQYMLWTGSSSLSYYLWLAPYIRFIHDNLKVPQTLSCKGLLKSLKEKDNERHPFPFDKSKLTYQNRPLYWLRRLDYYLWEENENKDKKDQDSTISSFCFRKGGLSIEHVHPQNQDQQDKDNKWQEENIHSFGNLVLISSSFNSTQSNDSVTVKFARIKDQIKKKKIESLKLYKIYKDYKENKTEWTEKNSNKHQEDMIKILSESFNFSD